MRPGDIVFGDYDGIVVIPEEAAEEVITREIDKVEGEKMNFFRELPCARYMTSTAYCNCDIISVCSSVSWIWSDMYLEYPGQGLMSPKQGDKSRS